MDRKFNPTLCQVVNILNDGQFHDGTSIGEALGMTRSAVWKVIQKLISYQVPVLSIKGKGYALPSPLILLDPQKIRADLDNKKLEIQIFESISSTNDYLRVKKNAKAPQACIAEQQTRGKGRLDRRWYSPFAQNIYLSFLYSFQKDISELAGLSLVVGLAIVSVLKSYGVNESLLVKWPNDILYDQRKLAGNLIEIQAESHGESRSIIGIGINVNMQAENTPIDQAWISIAQILGCYIDRNELYARLINRLVEYLHRFNALGFASFQEEWDEVDSLHAQTISIKSGNNLFEGKVLGVNTQGHLLVRLANGSERSFSSGDATILKKR